MAGRRRLRIRHRVPRVNYTQTGYKLFDRKQAIGTGTSSKATVGKAYGHHNFLLDARASRRDAKTLRIDSRVDLARTSSDGVGLYRHANFGTRAARMVRYRGCQE